MGSRELSLSLSATFQRKMKMPKASPFPLAEKGTFHNILKSEKGLNRGGKTLLRIMLTDPSPTTT